MTGAFPDVLAAVAFGLPHAHKNNAKLRFIGSLK